jgi:hypothetical protein
MSHVHVSHHIIYLYKVVPIKFVSLEISQEAVQFIIENELTRKTSDVIG